MPIYEYRCAACGHHLEALQKMTEAPLRKCPDCGKSQLRRLVSAPQFRLKGSGWYETDFKGDKETKRNLSGDSGDGESKSDAAPETSAKDEAKKEVAAAKSDGAADKAAKPKPTTVKSAAHGKKRAAKGRGSKSARG